jgi:ADP-ribose pyrophosphatase
VRFPDGREMRVDVVVHAGAVTLVPVDEQGQVWLIRQYRHPAGKLLLELPAGVVEAGEDPAASAQREVREEIGMGARHLKPVGEFFLAPGYSTELMRVYLATGLFPEALDPDEDEQITVEKVPFDEALRMAEQGEIQDAKTIAALFLARRHLQGS